MNKLVEQKSISILVGNIFVAILIFSTLSAPLESFAFGPPPPIRVDVHFDFDTAEGFEKIEYNGPDWDDITVFVLRQGTIGTINITLSSSETNKTVVADLRYGGYPHFNDGWWYNDFLPDGVTYSFEPSNITITPRSNVNVIMRISSAPRTPQGSYNLVLQLQPAFVPPFYNDDPHSYRTILTIIESTSPYTTDTVMSPTTYVTETITYTSTATTTVTTLTDLVAESSVYAWAIGTTVTATVLAIFLLKRSRR